MQKITQRMSSASIVGAYIFAGPLLGLAVNLAISGPQLSAGFGVLVIFGLIGCYFFGAVPALIAAVTHLVLNHFSARKIPKLILVTISATISELGFLLLFKKWDHLIVDLPYFLPSAAVAALVIGWFLTRNENGRQFA